VGLEWGQLSLVSTTEELLGRKSIGSGLKNREYGRGIHRADHAALTFLKSWHQLRREAAATRSVQFTRGLRPQSSFSVVYHMKFDPEQQKDLQQAFQ
jgi:hypothetical protein